MTNHLLMLCCLLLGCNQNITTATASQDKSFLYQHWIHSYEDDSKENDTTNNYKTYRPAFYHFPPARGRDGFEIKPDGTFISHAIAPADGNLSVPERWKLDKDKLIVTGEITLSTFKIISLSKEKLVLQTLQSQ